MAAAGGNWECPTLLGYQDEEVGQHKVDYTTSKIGGAPVSKKGR